MDSDTDVCQTEQPQISYSVDFTAEQSSAMGSPILLDREGTFRGEKSETVLVNSKVKLLYSQLPVKPV